MKVLNIGGDPFPPYQYLDENRNVHGLDYDIVKKTVDLMGYESKFIIDEWSVIETMLKNKELDVLFQVQKTPEREKVYYFSEKLRDAVTSIVTSGDNVDYNVINDLFKDGSKLGVIENYQYGDEIDCIGVENKVQFKSLEDLCDSLNNKEIKFGVVDLGVFNFLNKENIYKNIKVIEKLNFNRPLYVVFNDELVRDKFNLYLNKAK